MVDLFNNYRKNKSIGWDFMFDFNKKFIALGIEYNEDCFKPLGIIRFALDHKIN